MESQRHVDYDVLKSKMILKQTLYRLPLYRPTPARARIHEVSTRLHFYWRRYAVRWATSVGVVFVLASFTFVLFSFLAFQLQTWME